MDAIYGRQSLAVLSGDFELRSTVPFLGAGVCTQEEKCH